MSKNLPAEQKANLLLQKVTLIIAKTAEILHWWLVGAMLIITICSLIWATPVTEWLKTAAINDSMVSCYGFTLPILSASMLAIFAFCSAIVLSLMAMIFRNVYLILKTAEGKTWFARGNTPFQQDIVRMFREIGIFFIGVSVMSLASVAFVSFLGGKPDGFNYLSCFTGLVFLCVSQFFNYGANLEKDLDGLV